MKKIFILGSFFLAASLLAVGTDTKPTTQPTTQEATKDRFTTTNDHKLGNQVRALVAEIVGPQGNAIVLVIDEGDVKLIGKVPSEEVKTKLSKAVQQIKGVKSVHNKLDVEKKK